MTIPACVNPVSIKDKVEDPGFNLLVDQAQARADAINQVKPYLLDFEANSRCVGSCAYCYANSESTTDYMIPEEKIQKIIDEAWELGVRRIQWAGGCCLAHPQWFEHVRYAGEKGVESLLASGGPISKRDAQRIVELGDCVVSVGINLASVDQEAFNKTHTNPKMLEAKIEGYRNLLNAGYPAEKVIVLITLTKPIINSVERTMDFFIDQMGCHSFCLLPFRTCGFGKDNEKWEPTLTEVKGALLHRAKRLGDHWLRIGSSDGSYFYCRAAIAILYDGSVVPCTMFRDTKYIAGNIYQESLKSIFDKGRDDLLFNRSVKGYCGGECENSDICFGCRATALHYLGDEYASDPKCFMNPEAQEQYFS